MRVNTTRNDGGPTRWGAIGCCFFFAMLFAIVLAFDCKMSQKLVAGVSLLNRLLLLSPGISFHPSLSLLFIYFRFGLFGCLQKRNSGRWCPGE